MSAEIDTIDDDDWRRAGALFHELVDLDESARSDRIARIDEGDRALRAAVEILLAGDATADERLPRPGFGIDLVAIQRLELPRLEGETIGRFRVLERVGSGGMGVVHRAEDTWLGREVALKFPLVTRALGDSARRQIVDEARAAGALDHPNVCPIYEVGDSACGPFFAMPFYHGETLKQRMARGGALSVDESLAIVSQLSAGLECAHAAGIVHRDIKPGNVMLLPDGGVRLLDFGLALASENDLPGINGIRGTVSYSAPEQIRGERSDVHTDLWSLGVILYEMLAGVRPFIGDSDLAVLHSILHDEPKPLGAFACAVPPELETLTHALIAKDPVARLLNASDVSRSVGAIVAGISAARGQDTATLPHVMLHRGARFTPRAIVAATLLVGTLVTSGAMWWRTPRTLMARGQLAPHDTLVLADFDVAGSDSSLGRALTLLFRQGFDDFGAVSLLPPSDVSSALRRMRRPPGASVTLEVARELATREGARAILSAQAVPLGTGYVVSVQLLGTGSGEVLASAKAAAPNPERDLPAAVAQLGETLRRRIGAPRGVATRQRVERKKLTTSSLSALRLTYSTSKLTGVEGITAIREALALDSTFAYAWMILGNQLSGLEGRSAVADSAFTMAFRLRDQLSEMERAQVSALYSINVWRDRARGQTILEHALDQDTTIWRAVPMNLADRLVASRQFARAEAFARRIRPWRGIGVNVLPALTLAQAGQEHYAAADSTLESLRVARGAGDEIYRLAARNLAVARLRYDDVDSLLTPFRGRSAWIQLLRLRGELKAAHGAELGRDSVRLSVANAAGARFVPQAGRLLDHAREDLWLRHEPVRAGARLDSLLPVLGSVKETEDRLLVAAGAALQAAAGRPVAARALLDRAMRGADTVALRALYENHHTALGEIALAEGRYAEAMTHFRASDFGPDALPSSACAVCVLPYLARVAERAAWSDSVRIFWERYVSEPSIQRLGADQWFLATAYARLGESYEARGEPVRAAGYRRSLARIRANADADLAPSLRRVGTATTAKR